MSSHIKKMEKVKINSLSFTMKGKKIKDGVYVGVERGKETEPTLITAKQKKRKEGRWGGRGQKSRSMPHTVLSSLQAEVVGA